jgi:hypothetical protein
MEKINTYEIDWTIIAQGFGLPVDKTIEMFNDGRILGRLGEFLHQNSNDGMRENENSPFDIKEKNNTNSEVRTITSQVSFAPSKEVGYGRKVTEQGFLEKLTSVDQFILIDKRLIEEGILKMIKLTKEDVRKLPLGKNKSISSKKFYKEYDGNK